MPDEPEHYQPLFDANPCPMWAYEERTLTILAANQAALNLYGYPRDAFLALTLPQVCPPGPPSKAEPGASARRACHLKRGGASISVEVIETPLVLLGKKARLVVVGGAAAPGCQRQGVLPADLPFQALVERNSDWVWEVDSQGRYTYASPKVRDLLGYEPEEVLGRTPFDFMPPEEGARVAQHFARVAAAREPFVDMENMNLHKDGRRVLLETSGVPVLDALGNFQGYRGIDRDITRRKQAEDNLRLALAYNRGLIEASPDPLVTIGPDGYITDVNTATELATGYPRATLIGTVFSQYFTEPEKARLGYEKVFREGAVRDYPLDLRHKDGPAISVLYNAVLYRDAEGKVIGVFAAARDVTQLKRVEEALRRSHDELEARVQERTAEIEASNEALRDSEEKFRRLFATIADAVVVFDAETRAFLEANEAALRLYGYSHEEFLRRTYTDITVDQEASEPSIALALGGAIARIPLRYHRKKDGTVFPVEISGSAFSLGGRRVLCGMIRDITARQQAEETLRKSEQELADFFAESPLGLLWVGPDGVILKVNHAELELVGRREQDLVGHHVAELHADADAATDLLDRLARSETIQNFRARIRRKNGSLRHVLIDANSRWDQGRLLHSRWFVRDITRRVELEHEILTISEREQRRLGHDLHDDLCQQLAGIMFLCQSLAKELGPRSPAKTAKAAEISRMLQQAMLQTRELARGLSPVDLEAEGLMGALSQLASHTTKVFRRDCVFRCDSPVLVLDHAMGSHLYRIAQEAISNAIKHSKCSRVEVALKSDGHDILLSITDDGVGIRHPSAKHDGMGMRIMRYRASVIGGSLAVQRNAEGGTNVLCSVPNGLIPRRKRIPA